jgi:hypothetical protein
MLMQCGDLGGSLPAFPSTGNPRVQTAPCMNCTCNGRIVYAGTRGYQDEGLDLNPVTVSGDATNVYISLNTSWWVWGYWSADAGGGVVNCLAAGVPDDSDNNCDTGYYRVLVYR